MSMRRLVSLIIFLVLVCFQVQGNGQCVPTTDCNGNGVLDSCDLLLGSSDDCNSNLIPDECEIADLSSEDCNLNGIPDECEPVVPSQLVSTNGTFGEEFGHSVGMTESISVIGSPGDDSLGNNAGAVHVFRRVGTVWVDEIKLTASDPVPNDRFGEAVSANSDLVVVGAPDKANQTGAVYIFRRVGSNWWNLETKLTAFDGTPGFLYGTSVGTSNGRVYVGAPMTGTFAGSGAVYVYHNAGGSWMLEAKITSGAALAGDEFGGSISARDNLIAVGAPGTTVNQIARAGKAVIYQGLSGLWFQQALLTPDAPQQNGNFGASIAIGPGSLLVGAPGEDGDQGAAYLFDQGGSSWTLDQRVTSQIPDGNDNFGVSVAVGSGTAAVGAPGSNGGEGRIFTFRYVDGQWAVNSALEALNPADGDDSFGSSVAASGVFAMFGSSGAQTAYAHWIGTPADCNSNFVEDVCDITNGTSSDCNLNQIPDDCEISNGSQSDCNLNGIPDECEIAAGTLSDCNLNNVPDECDLSSGTSLDCNLNGNPDDCEVDCNNNGIPDDCDLQTGLAGDCNGNLIPDSCDLSLSLSNDCNGNTIPDECDVSSASSLDCNSNGTPDECDITQGVSFDCNANGIPDICDLAALSSLDCNLNSVPDECDIISGLSSDCDSDSNPDECELLSGSGIDCNFNGVLDNCDIASAVSNDCNLNTVPDECEIDVDTIPPVINNIPAGISLANDFNACGAIVNWDEPIVSDNCGISTFSSSHTSGSFFGIGTTTVQYTATDVSGNQTLAEFQIAIVDDELPTLTGVSGDILVNATLGACETLVSWLAPFPGDNCEVLSMTSSANPGDSFAVGNTLVTYSIVDVHGNSNSESFNVTVIDTQEPELTGIPATITASCEPGLCSALVTWVEPVATDNCQVFLVVSDFSSGSSFPVGETTVTYSVSDLSGNSATQSFLVVVEDQESPEFTNFPVEVNLETDSGLCQGTATWEIPGLIDNCGIENVTSSHVPGQVFELGTTPVSYSAVDVNGNETSLSFNVVVSDVEAPILSGVPGTITVEAEPGVCTGIVSWVDPVASDNCDTVTPVSSSPSGSSFPVGVSLVTFAATDASGNSTVTSVEIVVTDTQVPLISNMPADITQPVDANLCAATVTWFDPNASDNCSIASLNSDLPSGSVFQVGSTSVTYTAVDASGNTTQGSFNVTVVDDQSPTITGMPNQINLFAETDQCTAIAAWDLPIFEDNCQVSSSTSSHNPGDAFAVGTTVVSYQVTDNNGNSTENSFNVVVNDGQLPEIVGTLGDIQVSTDPGQCEAVVSWITPTANDNCGIQELSSSHLPGETFLVGSTVVTYLAVDENGLQSQRQFNVTVIDEENPAINNVPADITIDNTPGLCGALATWLPPGSSDNCNFLSLTSNHLSGSLFPVGSTEVIYTSTDFQGNSITASFFVSVNDVQAPTITGVPEDITINTDPDLCSAAVTWIEPAANDNCSVSTLVPTQASGTSFPVGSTIVTYTATDASGMESEASFNVEVIDDQAPVISDLASEIVLSSEAGVCGAVVTWTEPVVTDNCSVLSVAPDLANGSFFPVGLTSVVYTAVDGNQNSANAVLNVIVEDNEAPVITGTPGNLVATSEAGTCGATVSWIEPVALDNCDLETLTGTHIPSTVFQVGETQVSYTATDEVGNSSSISFLVTVIDAEVPQIIGMPGNILMNSDQGECGAVVTWIEPGAQDNCSVSSLDSNILSGTSLSVGTHDVIYTAVDVNGNEASSSFTVTVIDNEIPLIIGDLQDISVGTDPDSCHSIVNWLEPVAQDNCLTQSLTSDIPSGSVFVTGTTSVTYTATDIHGNASTHQFSVTVTDVQNPEVLGIPDSITLSTDPGSCEATASWVQPTSADNCSVLSFTGTHISGTSFPIGNTEVSYSAVDTSGNETIAVFTVTVEDDESPEILNLPVDINLVNDQGLCGAIATWIEPTAADNCGIASIDSSHQAGSLFPIGSTEVQYQALDSAGNSLTGTFNVVVSDQEMPELSGIPTDITLFADPGQCSAIHSWIDPVATDNCSVQTLEVTQGPGTGFLVGDTSVFYTVIDQAGNTITKSFVVTVLDDQTPEILGTPADITVTAEPGQCTAPVSWVPANASDNCSIETFIPSNNSGDHFPLGSTVVTYSATDASGNTSETTFVVQVIDEQAPEIAGLPAAFSVSADPDACGAVVTWIEPVSNDNCGLTDLSSDITSGSFLAVGATPVTYTAIDPSGNSTSMTFTVDVLDEEAPAIFSIPNDLVLQAETGLCGAIASWIEPQSSDNCGVASFVSDIQNGSFFDHGTTAVEYLATDIHGNQSVATFNVSVVDAELPVISSLPGNLTVNSDPGLCTAVVTWIEPVSNDNCGASTIAADIPAGSNFVVGTTQITYTATDSSGNQQIGQFNVTVTDAEAPVITSIPENILVENDLNSCSAAVTWLDPIAIDNCELATFSSNHLPGSSFDLGITQVSYTAVDQAGNETIVSFLVEVIDTQAPEITGLPQNFSVSTLQGQCGATVTWVPPVAGDNCQINNLASNIPSGAFLQLGITEVTYTAIDQSGNQISSNFNVEVIDTEAPILVDMPLDITVNNDAGFCTANVTWTNPTSLDNCGFSVVGSNIVPGTTFTLGTTEVVCVATDDAGNSTSSTFTVTVQDGEAPSFIDVPGDVFVENDLNQCGALVSWAPATAGDNCQMGTIVSSHDIGSFFPVGETVVTHTAIDAAGNEKDSSFTVHVSDSQLPDLLNVPASFSISADASECGALVSWTEPVAVDNCQISSVTSNLPSGTILPVGDTAVIYTAIDSSGNEKIDEFTVTVLDAELPSITGIPGDLSGVASPGECNTVVTWVEPTGSDNCLLQSLDSTHLPGAVFEVGTTVVTYTATDINGNHATESFTITVSDIEAPLISGMPDSMELLNDTGQCGAVVIWTEPTATDNCNLSALQSSVSSGSFIPVGTSTVVYTATDSSGNSSEHSFTITVNDIEFPVISGMPSDLVLSNDLGVCGASGSWIEPVAEDNCMVLSFGSNYQQGHVFPLGTTQVTYTATDNAGHSSTATFNVTVTDEEAPTIFGLPGDLVVQSDLGECGAVVSWQSPLTSDNCQVADFGSAAVNGGFYPVGVTAVTYSSTDQFGNNSTATFNVIVEDHEAPAIIGVPSIVTVESEIGTCQAVVTWEQPSSTDNCAVDTLVSDFLSGATFSIGDTTVTYSASDIHGNVTSASFVVEVLDSEAPIAIGMPEDITVSADAGVCSTSVSWTEPSVSDNCSAIGITSDIANGSSFSTGTTTVTYTAEDLYGNTSTAIFNVTVLDDQGPEILNMPLSIEVELPEQSCEAIVSWIEPGAIDNCGIQDLVSNYPSGSAFPVGGTTVLYTATDLSGNESYGMFQVSVLDTTNPVIGGLPQPIVSQTDPGQCGASVTWVEPTVFDNCNVAIFDSSHLPGSFIPVGTTTVSFTASDAGGNTATASFTITVADSENPVVVPSGAITVDADPGSCAAFVTVPSPVGTDNCLVSSLVNDFNGTSEASGIYPMETTVILWTVTDSYGNVGTASQAITVSVPQIDCNLNGSPDTCDIASGTSLDCNIDGIPDECQEDCNGNGVPDDCDLGTGALPDCNGNGIPDSCDISSGFTQDCDLSGVPDSCEIISGQLQDCNANGLPDLCEIGSGTALDCNDNSVPDSCDLATGVVTDCNFNSIPDNCDLTSGYSQDCNVNGVPDSCDFVSGSAIDCNGNFLPDSCEIAAGTEADCNGNAYLDSCEVQQGLVEDCNSNMIPDTCDLSAGSSPDCNNNLIPDECDITTGQVADCDINGIPDSCDLVNGTVSDCDNSGIPDQCEVASGQASDCNGNGIPDSCDIASGVSVDCNLTGIPDSCELAMGQVPDCDGNLVPDSCDLANGTVSDCDSSGIPDSCEVASGQVSDCNGNGIPDNCDLASGTVSDCDSSGIPDSCEVASGQAPDCNLNGVPDLCDLASGTDPDCDSSGIPDSCEVASGQTPDCDGNGAPDSCDIATGLVPDCDLSGVPDSCEVASGQTPDCDGNLIPDSCDISSGNVADCDASGIPDSCEVSSGQTADCNSNGIPDSCDITTGVEADCNDSGIPDSCEVLNGSVPDCNANSLPDSCDIAAGVAIDCDNDGLPDSCEVAQGSESDCNADGIPDLCQIASGELEDCNGNLVPDTCDVASGTSEDLNSDGLPDECQVQFRRGDANADSIVNIADGIFLLQNLFGGGPATTCEDGADANDDGGIDVSDVIFVLGFQFGGGAAPPAPFNECGVDPTDFDGLSCQSFGPCQ